MSLREELKQRRDEILRIAGPFGARDVRLFGSVARAEEGPESDVDFLVNLEPGRSLMDHAGLQIALEGLLSRRVDIATERGLRPRFKERVLSEAIAL